MEQVQQQLPKPQEEKVEKKAEKVEKPVKAAAAKEPIKPPENTKAKLEEKKEAKEEKKEFTLKRSYVVPLASAYAKPAKKRAGRAIKLLRQFAARHSKSPEASVKISEKVASFVNSRGSKKPPKKLKVAILKDKQGNVFVNPA